RRSRSTLTPCTTLFRSVDALPPEGEPILAEILNLIKSRTGCDFTLYKRPTIIRRLTRRMAFNNYDLPDYLELLRQNEEEVYLLRDRKSTRLNSSHVKIS